MTGSYQPWLVALSFGVALLASYTALDLVGRINRRKDAVGWPWLLSGALALGTGIWSMHFIGMLAYRLPIPVAFDTGITALSFVIAVVASGFALFIMSRREALQRTRLSISATLIGVGIATMHYTGMLAMRMSPPIAYSPALFVLSVLIAILATMVALSLPFFLQKRQSKWLVLSKVTSALLMAVAICGMHYTGMAAAEFSPGAVCTVAGANDAVDSGFLAVIIGSATLVLLVVTLVISALESHRNAALSQVNHDLTIIALYDPLTGLPNRALLEDRFTQASARATRAKLKAALMFVDLDLFKTVNDTYGHRMGDRVLQEVARRLAASIRAEDTVARLGGDEFVIVLAGISDAATATSIGRKLVAEVERPYDLDRKPIALSASIGISLYPDDATTFDALLEKADRAMYGVKQAGKKGVGLFTEVAA